MLCCVTFAPRSKLSSFSVENALLPSPMLLLVIASLVFLLLVLLRRRLESEEYPSDSDKIEDTLILALATDWY